MNAAQQILKTNILLESGTNELEIVEFSIGTNSYGINVAKVREIIRYPDAIVPVPESHPSVEGIANIRGQVIPIINLQKHLGETDQADKPASYIIISEFNKTMVGFRVGSVSRIHRLSWEQIESPTGMISSDEGIVTAIVKLDERMILLLDFEKITADINPQSGMEASVEGAVVKENKEFDRSSCTVFIVEDSSYIQKIITCTLEKAGYKVCAASDGKAAWDKLTSIVGSEHFKSINDHINIIISDIEMPRMDGLHLIKNIKSNEALRKVPCVVFSSLISPEMSLKCKSVGADAEISKPEIGNLVNLVDSFVKPQV